MTEKRFTIEKDGGLYRIFDNGKIIPILDGQPICDLLNKLNDNQCLYATSFERDNFHDKTLEYIEDMKTLKNENRELRKENDWLKRQKEKFLGKWSVANSKNIQLNQENEQLKQENKRLHTEWRMQKKIIETYGKRVNR